MIPACSREQPREGLRYDQCRLIPIIENLFNHSRRSVLLAMQLCLQMLLGVLLMSSTLPAQAVHEGPRIGVVVSNDAPYFTLTYQQMTRRVLSRLPDTRFVLLNASSLSDHQERADFELLVTIGSNAARSALEHTAETPLLATFLSKATYEQLVDHSVKDAIHRPISAIFTDQPALYRLRLARHILPDAQVIGTALRPDRQATRAELSEAATQTGFALSITAIDDTTSNPNQNLQPAFHDADAFIAIPDSAQINRASSRWILNLGYRTRIPIIGFSQTYTRNGAIASLYTTPQDVGRHAGEAIISWLCCADPHIWQPVPSRYFTIDTNPVAAQVLGIELAPISELQQAVLNSVTP